MPASLEHLLVDRATISRLAEVNTGPGRWTENLQAIATDVKWRTFAASGRELALAEQLRVEVSHVGYCLPGVDIGKDDEIQITAKEGMAVVGEMFRVTAVLPPSLVHHQKVLLVIVQRAK